MTIYENPEPQDFQAPQYSKRQLRVITLLSTRSKELSNRYKAILIALQNSHNPERFVQAAHSARYLIRHLYKINPATPVFEGPPDALNEIRNFVDAWKEPESGESILEAGKRLVEYFEKTQVNLKKPLVDLFINEDISGMASEEHLEPLISSLREKIKYFDKIAHYNTPDITDNSFENALYGFEGIIIGLLSEHFELLSEVEKLVAKKIPQDSDLEELQSFRSRPKLFDSFFQNLSQLGWFHPLKKASYFKTPVGSKKHPDGGISAPLWPQCTFLKKCAPVFPKDVITLILEADSTDNWNVISDFAEIALLVPSNEVKRLIKEKTKIWVRKYSITNLPFTLAELVVKLSNDNEYEAFQLAGQLLYLRRNHLVNENDEVSQIARSDKAVGYFSGWYYERVLKTIMPALIKQNHKEIIKLISKILNTAVTMENPDQTKDPKNDGLSIHRPTIADNPDNKYGNHFVNSLIDSLRNALIEIEKTNALKAEDCLKLLRKYKPYIFLRLELYTLTKFPNNHIDRIKEIVTDNDIVYSLVLDYEFDALLRASFGLLPNDSRNQYLKIVEKGPESNE